MQVSSRKLACISIYIIQVTLLFHHLCKCNLLLRSIEEYAYFTISKYKVGKAIISLFLTEKTSVIRSFRQMFTNQEELQEGLTILHLPSNFWHGFACSSF